MGKKSSAVYWGRAQAVARTFTRSPKVVSLVFAALVEVRPAQDPEVTIDEGVLSAGRRSRLGHAKTSNRECP